MEIRPFRGWRYCPGAGGDVGPFLAPPYDVLSAEDKRALLDRCDRNIVAVDLPHVPPGEAGPDKLYRQAGERLGQWQASGVLCQDAAPALYVCEQTFQWAGRGYDRLAVLCGLRATELGRDVIPHEHTFAGPKADRLKLTEHTRTQLSPVFGFYEDFGDEVCETLRTACRREPDAQGRLGEVLEKLWVVSDPDVIAAVQASVRERAVFIADGHHRYATALTYRDGLRGAGRIDDDHEANFVLFALVARSDPGLLVLPTHRIVRGLRGDFDIAKLIGEAKAFSWQRISVEELAPRDAGSVLHRYGPGAMAFLGADPAEIWIGKLADPSAMRRAAPDKTDAWRSLDVAVLHKLIIDEALTPWRTDDVFVEYTPDGRAVFAACESGRAQLGVCLQGTPLAVVEALARAGQTMPHKSTYFYPKLAAGLVLKPLY